MFTIILYLGWNVTFSTNKIYNFLVVIFYKGLLLFGGHFLGGMCYFLGLRLEINVTFGRPLFSGDSLLSEFYGIRLIKCHASLCTCWSVGFYFLSKFTADFVDNFASCLLIVATILFAFQTLITYPENRLWI